MQAFSASGLNSLDSTFFALLTFVTVTRCAQVSFVYWLLKRLLGPKIELVTDRSIIIFLLVGVLCYMASPLITVTLGSLADRVPASSRIYLFLSNWLASAIGFTLITPLILSFSGNFKVTDMGHRLRIALPILITITIVTSLMRAYTNLEIANRESEIDRRVNDAIHSLEATFDSITIPFESANSLLDLNVPSRSYFDAVTSSLANRFRNFLSLNMAVWISEEERLSQGLEFLELIPGQTISFTPSTPKDNYLVVNTPAAYEYFTIPDNLDITDTMSGLNSVLIETGDSQSMLAIEQTLQATNAPYRLIAGANLYKPDMPLDTPEQRREAQYGMTVMNLNMVNLIRRIFLTKLPRGFEACIYIKPQSEDGNSKIIFSSSNACEFHMFLDEATQANFNLFDQNLEVRLVNNEAASLPYYSTVGIIVLIGAALSSCIFVGWIISISGRRLQTEQTVELRTAQLKKEISDRINAERKLTDSMRLLESVNQGLSGLVVEDKYQTLDNLLQQTMDISGCGKVLMGIVTKDHKGVPSCIARSVKEFTWKDAWADPIDYAGGEWRELKRKKTLLNHSIETGEIVISNKPGRDKESSTQDILFENILIIPIHYQEQLIGIIALADREGGFANEVIHSIQPIIATFGVAIKNLIDDEIKSSLNHQLLKQAITDPLTGLINRSGLQQELTKIIKNRTAKGCLYIHIDLDRFNLINEKHGHIAGDKLLQQLADYLSTEIKAPNHLYHFSGDKFALLMPPAENETTEAYLNKLLDRVRSFRFSWEGNILSVNASLGVVRITPLDNDVTKLFQKADIACQAAKTCGRNRYQIYSDKALPEQTKTDEMFWLALINSGLENDGYELYAQEIKSLSTATEHISKMEVLVRLSDKEGVVHTPTQFLPTAERYGLSTLLDKAVVTKSLCWLSTLDKKDKTLPRLSINLSGPSLADPEFLDFLLETIPKHGDYWSFLCFEITETMAISNLVRAKALISALKKHGCMFAIDDFGSGLSSLSYLKEFDVDFLKIDGSFVIDICTDERDKAMVKSIHEMANTLGMETIAEYAENDDIVNALRELGIDCAQGNAFGRPKPINEFI